MATVAISALPAATSLSTSDIMVVNQSGVTKQAALSFLTYVTFPSGTVMLFQQTSAPTGWTKSVANNDKALRIVTGSVSTGGATAFSSVFNAAGGSTVLTTSHLPASGLSIPALAAGTLTAPSLTVNIRTGSGTPGSPAVLIDSASGQLQKLSDPSSVTNLTAVGTTDTGTVTGSTATGTTGNMGSGTGHTHTTPDLAYVDIIAATKD